MPSAFDERLLDLVAAHLLLVASDGRILRANRHCRERLLVEPDEVPFWQALVPAGERSAAESAFLAGRDGGGEFTIESPIAYRGGEVRRVEWSCSPAGGGNILATGVEIAERVPGGLTQPTAEEYLLLFENNPHPMWVFDTETLRFLAVNEAAVTHYGYSRPEFLAMTIADLATHKDGLGPRGGCWRHRKKDGGEIDVEVTAARVSYAGRDARLVLAHDVTERNRAERARSESERRYRDLFENAPLGIYRTTPDGRILMLNPAVLRMLGYDSFEQLMARNLEDEGFEPDYPRSEFKRRLAEDGEIRGHEARWMKADGSTIYVRESARAMYAADGTLAWYEGTVEDITERKLAEEALRASEARFRAVFEGAAGGILILGTDGRVRESNAAAQEMLGHDERELLDLRYDCLIDPEDIETGQAAARQVAQGTVDHTQFELRLRRKDGGVIWARVSASLVRGPVREPQFVIAMIEDVTTRKQAEEQLRRTVEDLARSNAELQDFAYVASHDLQEPLRMVVSFMQLLRSRYQEKLDGEAGEFIGYAVDGARRMKVLIDDLLAYSRVGSRARPFRMIRSRAAFEQALMNLTVALDESGAEVTAGELPELAADAGQLVQLFQNLIGNAVKFRNGDVPRVHVSSERTDTGWMFSVVDNGIGIAPQHRERIFEIFHRLHTKAAYPGSGIGLTVCKKIVERHSGCIWVESEPGKGSTFRFTIADLPCGH